MDWVHFNSVYWWFFQVVWVIKCTDHMIYILQVINVGSSLKFSITLYR